VLISKLPKKQIKILGESYYQKEKCSASDRSSTRMFNSICFSTLCIKQKNSTIMSFRKRKETTVNNMIHNILPGGNFHLNTVIYPSKFHSKSTYSLQGQCLLLLVQCTASDSCPYER
jgi:hypothetical protein